MKAKKLKIPHEPIKGFHETWTTDKLLELYLKNSKIRGPFEATKLPEEVFIAELFRRVSALEKLLLE
jgi:hypothetical protein